MTTVNRQEVANLIRRLARSAEIYGEHLSKHTDYWEGGGDPMESHFELLNEAELMIKDLTEL